LSWPLVCWLEGAAGPARGEGASGSNLPRTPTPRPHYQGRHQSGDRRSAWYWPSQQLRFIWRNSLRKCACAVVCKPQLPPAVERP